MKQPLLHALVFFHHLPQQCVTFNLRLMWNVAVSEQHVSTASQGPGQGAPSCIMGEGYQ